MKTTKKIATEKTLAYAVAFLFTKECAGTFMIGSKMYQHIKTVYDVRDDGRGTNTLEIVYDFEAMKYAVLVASDEQIGGKEVRIL